MSDILMQLNNVLNERRHANPETSYVAKLNELGLDKILEKISEESTEVILSAKNSNSSLNRTKMVGEVADLWFHCMVLLSHLDVDISEVLDCLRERFGVSGLEEKNLRSK